jgi:uncharacterized protein YndB with AHSA1/START domain
MVTTKLDRDARRASATAIISAPAQAVFDVVADPQMHPVIDGGQTVRRALEGVPTRLSMGVKFSMSVRRVWGYHIENTVVEWDEPHLIAWRHWAGHRWRYQLKDVPGGTEVTETFDWSTSLFPWALERGGYPARNLEGIVGTLERLAAVVAERGAPTA